MSQFSLWVRSWATTTLCDPTLTHDDFVRITGHPRRLCKDHGPPTTILWGSRATMKTLNSSFLMRFAALFLLIVVFSLVRNTNDNIKAVQGCFVFRMESPMLLAMVNAAKSSGRSPVKKEESKVVKKEESSAPCHFQWTILAMYSFLFSTLVHLEIIFLPWRHAAHTITLGPISKEAQKWLASWTIKNDRWCVYGESV